MDAPRWGHFSTALALSSHRSSLFLSSTPHSLPFPPLPSVPTAAPGWEPALFLPGSRPLPRPQPTGYHRARRCCCSPGWGWGSVSSHPLPPHHPALLAPTDGPHPAIDGWGAWITQGPRLFLMPPAQKINIPPLPQLPCTDQPPRPHSHRFLPSPNIHPASSDLTRL